LKPDKSWIPFGERLKQRLDSIHRELDRLLELSTITYINRNKSGSGVFTAGSDWGWGPTDNAQDRLRLSLSADYATWFSLFGTLFKVLPPDIARRMQEPDDLIRRWIERDKRFDTSIPSTIPKAKALLASAVGELKGLIDLVAGESPLPEIVVAIPDTNALMDTPDFSKI
jgi:hypothetical protein